MENHKPFINLLSKALSGNEIVVTDMGTSFTCTMQTFKISNPKTKSSCGCGVSFSF